METKSIKDVDEETWKDFRALAIRNNMKMSILLKLMVNEFQKNSRDFWKDIISRKKSLSNEEAESIEEMADVFEVITAILENKKWDLKKVIEVQKKKRDQKGAFRDKVILDES